MRKSFTAIDQVNINAKLADLQEQQYQTLLMLDAVIDLLVEKNIVTRSALENKLKQIDQSWEEAAHFPNTPTQ